MTGIGSHLAHLAALLALVVACGQSEREKRSPGSAEPEQRASAEPAKPASGEVEYDKKAEREAMVEEQILARGVRDPKVLEAMKRVPRHEFVPDGMRSFAYQDRPLPIGEDQTISQPYVVAAMTELGKIDEDSKVLEVGTGSGYQAAVLAEIADEVYSIEIIEELGKRAARDLERLGYDNVHTRIGDGYAGWPDEAPFDAIIVTAAPPRIPQPLKDQLKVGGRLVIPVGDYYQELLVITRTKEGFDRQTVFPVRFVPMTGEAQKNTTDPL